MIIQEKINKDGAHIMNRCNELGLRMTPVKNYEIIEWSPMFVILLYEKAEEAPKIDDRLAKAEAENARLRGKA